MKFFKKPKILPCECEACGAIFQPKTRHIYPSNYTSLVYVRCPICKNQCIVRFEKGVKNET